MRSTDTSYDYHPKKLSSDTIIRGLPSGVTVGDFWSWAYSDVMMNTIRSVFAEYIVGLALNAVSDPRIEWGPVDLIYRGKGIEVKSSAFLQSWPQTRHSNVRFDIEARKNSWDPETGRFLPIDSRPADCYVFCLFPDKSEVEGMILDVSAWRFYVLDRDVIDRELGERKSVGLNLLERLTHAVRHEELRESIDYALSRKEQTPG